VEQIFENLVLKFWRILKILILVYGSGSGAI